VDVRKKFVNIYVEGVCMLRWITFGVNVNISIMNVITIPTCNCMCQDFSISINF